MGISWHGSCSSNCNICIN